MQQNKNFFTYLIGWTSLNQYYYGVRYSKNAHPDDLWTRYFTSSNVVKDYREKYGEPDVIQVRKTFQTKNEAINWEEKVLKRLKVLKSEKWLNANIRGFKFSSEGSPRSNECRKKISSKRLEYLKNLTEEERELINQRSREAGIKGAKKIGEKAKERMADPDYLQKHINAHNTPEYLEKMSQKITEAFQREDVQQRHLESVNTEDYKENMRQFTKNLWKSDVHREKVSSSLKQTLSSPEHRQLMSERAKKSTQKRLETRRLNQLKKEKQNETQII